MAHIGIVGDGPGGLSAALFLAKADHAVTVFGTDTTAMHYALISNYLGITQIPGSDFQETARSQVTSFGATIVDAEVTGVSGTQGAFAITTADGTTTYDFLILTEGRAAPLADSMGLDRTDDGLTVDRDGRSSQDGVYVVGRSVRPTRSQAIISAGDGAAAALDILAREAGKDIQDWDSPPKS